MIETGQADGLVVSKLDRLSRSVAHFAGLLERFRKAGYTLVVLDLGVDTSSVTGEAMAGVVSVFAQMERRRIGERTKEALAVAKVQGTKSGKPIGRPRAIDPKLRARVRRMRSRGMSYPVIAQRLNDEGVPTAQGGKQWYPATVRKALTVK